MVDRRLRRVPEFVIGRRWNNPDTRMAAAGDPARSSKTGEEWEAVTELMRMAVLRPPEPAGAGAAIIVTEQPPEDPEDEVLAAARESAAIQANVLADVNAGRVPDARQIIEQHLGHMPSITAMPDGMSSAFSDSQVLTSPFIRSCRRGRSELASVAGEAA